MEKLDAAHDDENIRLIQEGVVLGRRYDISKQKPKKYTQKMGFLLDEILEGEKKERILGVTNSRIRGEEVKQRRHS